MEGWIGGCGQKEESSRVWDLEKEHMQEIIKPKWMAEMEIKIAREED